MIQEIQADVNFARNGPGYARSSNGSLKYASKVGEIVTVATRQTSTERISGTRLVRPSQARMILPRGGNSDVDESILITH